MLFENFQSSVSSHKFKLCNWDTNFFPPSPDQTRPPLSHYTYSNHSYPTPLHFSLHSVRDARFWSRSNILLIASSIMLPVSGTFLCSLFHVICVSWPYGPCLSVLCFGATRSCKAWCWVLFVIFIILSLSLTLLPPLPSHHLPTGIISCWEICDRA